MSKYHFNVCSLSGHWHDEIIDATDLNVAWTLLILKNSNNMREVRLLRHRSPNGFVVPYR
mgnify:FL=1